MDFKRLNILTGQNLRRALRGWLSTPDSSVNYKTALELHLEGTTTWFTEDKSFSEWKDPNYKKSGSLLLVYGRRTLYRPLHPALFLTDVLLIAGTGKTVLTCVSSKSFRGPQLMLSNVD
jgi:hypothetical protein